MKMTELHQNFSLIRTVYDNLSYQRVFDLMEAYKEAEEKIRTVEEYRQEIVKKYADEEGKIPEENQEKANKEFQEVLDVDIKFKNPLTFTQKDFEGSKLTGLQVMQLSGFIAKAKPAKKTANKNKS